MIPNGLSCVQYFSTFVNFLRFHLINEAPSGDMFPRWLHISLKMMLLVLKNAENCIQMDLQMSTIYFVEILTIYLTVNGRIIVTKRRRATCDPHQTWMFL